jgi:hypothetical protein
MEGWCASAKRRVEGRASARSQIPLMKSFCEFTGCTVCVRKKGPNVAHACFQKENVSSFFSILKRNDNFSLKEDASLLDDSSRALAHHGADTGALDSRSYLV